MERVLCDLASEYDEKEQDEDLEISSEACDSRPSEGNQTHESSELAPRNEDDLDC